MEYVTGYFTVERNLVGATLRELESKLGFRPGRLSQGARILLLLRQPTVGEFVFAGSTRYSDAKGLVDLARRRNVPIPHAWRGQRLVKVVPNLGHNEAEWYPQAQSPVEQWQLIRAVPAEEISHLQGAQSYWPPRNR
jgi:hypothetical protein